MNNKLIRVSQYTLGHCYTLTHLNLYEVGTVNKQNIFILMGNIVHKKLNKFNNVR